MKCAARRIPGSDSDHCNEPVTPVSGAQEVGGYSWAYQASTDHSICIGSLSEKHALFAGACSLTKQQNLRVTCAQLFLRMLKTNEGEKLFAINTYGRPKTDSNY